MKIKNVLITALTVIILLITVSIIVFNMFDIHLNLTTYHKQTDGEYTFSFKGSFGTVRKVNISKSSKKLCSLPFNTTADVFSDSYKVIYDDINFDGVPDVLLVSAIDDDKDLHYTAFIYDKGNDTFVYKDALADLANPVPDSEKNAIFTTRTDKIFTEEPKPNTPDKYEEKRIITKYEYLNGEPTATEERVLTFYSETNYYCYSVYEYNEKYGKLTYVDEKWFHPNKLSDFPLSWD